jgi:hypothetical protein
MKRTIFGILWFLAFVLLTIEIGGKVARHRVLNMQITPEREKALSEAAARGIDIGNIAEGEFVAEYWPFIIFGSLVAAIGGTTAGALPGTKRGIRHG